MSAQNSAWGKGLSQEEFMIKDECIVLNENDDIIGHGNKKQVHTFSKEHPRGILHRAFSVFLFNSEGKLLLQQRAADKITFPNVWTNTCCSHPLYGFEPNEVDNKESLLTGQVTGVKNAAIRKLEHELGIPTSTFSVDDFKFLTRLHYWAADVVTHGKESIWGEHEIDYILFAQKDIPKVTANAEEVSDVKYVSLTELQEMMKPGNGLLWSPWFRIIAERFLIPHWWKDLRTTLTTDVYTDVTTIHRFDPTHEHMGGAGHAKSWLGSEEGIAYGPKLTGNTTLKQGAYGKVSIHKHSKFDQFSRLDEVYAALYFKYILKLPDSVEENTPAVKFCNEMLGKVSRSFAAVIRQLPKGLCLDILLFYLALRALDTIEDDMSAFKGREKEKIKHLCNFYQTGLVTPEWRMTGVGLADEKTLLENYYLCVEVFRNLPQSSQDVIADITRRMGEGMASFAQKDLGQGTVKIADYDLYCHYVAGLVGEGLSRLFVATGYENDKVREVSTTLANTMGLFLQKTNIIRDYLEDYVDGRAFWPHEVWALYAPNGDLGDFAKPENIQASLKCLNHLIMDALLCVPDCIEYMNLLHTEEVFRFCAIPQVMAIATLAELYNNPKVFTGVVKIRKGLTAKMIMETKTLDGLYKWFYLMANEILHKIPITLPDRSNREINEKTAEICKKIIKLTQKKAKPMVVKSYLGFSSVFASVTGLITGCHLLKSYRQLVKNSSSSSDSSSSNSVVAASTSAIWKSVVKSNSLSSMLFFGSMAIVTSYGMISCRIKRSQKNYAKAK
jgi:farnesyl-diphosphate farnesyltransferase